MPRKFIDLSVALETGIVSDPPMALPEIEYVDHAMSADQICSFFPEVHIFFLSKFKCPWTLLVLFAISRC